MSAFEHPSLNLPVTQEQRERSLEYLQGAYAEGRLTIYEFDSRAGTVLSATTRRELNQAFTGLARVPVGTGATLLGRRRSSGPGAGARVGATVAHLSGLGSFVVGPAVVYAMAPHGGYARREAAKAFNFQLVSLVVLATLSIFLDGFLGGALLGVAGFAWLMLTIAGVAHAGSGDDWRNPVSRVVPLRLLDEGDPVGRGPKQLGR